MTQQLKLCSMREFHALSRMKRMLCVFMQTTASVTVNPCIMQVLYKPRVGLYKMIVRRENLYCNALYPMQSHA
jgi:hypothetical protein